MDKRKPVKFLIVRNLLCEIGLKDRENPKPYRTGNIIVHGLICLFIRIMTDLLQHILAS